MKIQFKYRIVRIISLVVYYLVESSPESSWRSFSANPENAWVFDTKEAAQKECEKIPEKRFQSVYVESFEI